MNYNYFNIDENAIRHRTYNWQYNYGQHKYIIHFSYEDYCRIKDKNHLGALTLIASPIIISKNKTSIRFGPNNMQFVYLGRDELIGSFEFEPSNAIKGVFSIVTFKIYLPNNTSKVCNLAMPTEMRDTLLEFYEIILTGNEKELVKKIDYNLNCRMADIIDNTIKNLAQFSEWLKIDDNNDDNNEYSKDLLDKAYGSLERANSIIYNHRYYNRSKFRKDD